MLTFETAADVQPASRHRGTKRRDLRTYHDELVDARQIERRLADILKAGADGGVKVTRAQDSDGLWMYRMRWRYRDRRR